MSKSNKVHTGRKFSYAQASDPWWKQKIIQAVEKWTGRGHLQRVYDEIYAEPGGPDPFSVWGKGLEKLGIEMAYDADRLEQVPREGPLIFIANHPFGIVDGAMLLHLVTRVRKDYFLLINEVISHEPFLEDHLLPVDFRKGDKAKQNNLRSRRRATERLQRGDALVIFPAGGISTAKRPWGKAEELPWKRFIGRRIHETRCTVVPIFFHGQNSRLFQWVSQIHMNLRLGLLLYEVMNKRGKTIRAEIGTPIPYAEMEVYREVPELIDFLKARTLALEEAGGGSGSPA